MKKILIILLLATNSAYALSQDHDGIFVCNNGEIDFISDAPLELIEASNARLSGALNLNDRAFSFTVPVKGFEGFNSSLQRVHFNEDYMETEIHPNSTFKGRIIEEVDLSVPGKYKVRAKGKLNIHGIEIDRIIRCDLDVKSDQISAWAAFTVFVADHNITIPSILNQKIATEIKVNVKLTLIPSAK